MRKIGKRENMCRRNKEYLMRVTGWLSPAGDSLCLSSLVYISVPHCPFSGLCMSLSLFLSLFPFLSVPVSLSTSECVFLSPTLYFFLSLYNYSSISLSFLSAFLQTFGIHFRSLSILLYVMVEKARSKKKRFQRRRKEKSSPRDCGSSTEQQKP